MNGLTISVPEGAMCSLYPGVPSAWKFSVLDPANAIPVTSTVTECGTTDYHYADLDAGLYHYGVTMEGYYSFSRIVNHTGSTRLEISLEKMAGGGYENDFLMLCTPEYEENALVSRKDAWGPAYERLFCTPWFSEERPSRHQQTTNEELAAFIEKLQKTNENMHIFSLGKSPKYGYDIPLVLFTRESVGGMTLAQAAEVIRQNGKPTVQYSAQCHSAEPDSGEGTLSMMVSLSGEYGSILDSVDIYIIPRINPDGAYEATRFAPATGEDLNRDYLYQHNAEVRMVVAAYNLFRPEVCIDGHGKRMPLTNTEDICTDVELQACAGALNHPAAMANLAMRIAGSALEKARSLGLRGHFYARLACPAGSVAGSSYFGTRNSLSFLVETPGQLNAGGYYLERRVISQYAAASAIIDYTAEHAEEILSTVRDSRAYMRKIGPVYDERDVIVLEHGAVETGTWPIPLLHVPTGTVVNPNHAEPYTEHTEAILTRPRATAYAIPAGLAEEQEILRVVNGHALEHDWIPAGSTVMLRQYMQTEDGISLTQEQPICFENGAYVFPNTADSTILGVIMEPDFNRPATDRKITLVRMGLITADEQGYLPLYRYCHDLKDGKI